MQRIFPAPENYHISRLKAQAERICCHIGPGFINNADYPQRHPLLANQQPVRALFHGQNFSHRVLQAFNLPQSFCHLGNPGLCQKQAVHKARGHSVFSGPLHICMVGLQKYFHICHQIICPCGQSFIFPAGRQCAQHCLRLFCIFSNLFQCKIHIIPPFCHLFHCLITPPAEIISFFPFVLRNISFHFRPFSVILLKRTDKFSIYHNSITSSAPFVIPDRRNFYTF